MRLTFPSSHTSVNKKKFGNSHASTEKAGASPIIPRFYNQYPVHKRHLMIRSLDPSYVRCHSLSQKEKFDDEPEGERKLTDRKFQHPINQEVGEKKVSHRQTAKSQFESVTVFPICNGKCARADTTFGISLDVVLASRHHPNPRSNTLLSAGNGPRGLVLPLCRYGPLSSLTERPRINIEIILCPLEKHFKT